MLKCVLKDMSLMDCQGQCHDGADNTAGVRTGVAIEICEIEQIAVFTLCYGHTLKCDYLTQLAIDTVGEISKLLNYSPQWDALFE